ncbi:N-acetyllactosaminide beta-1,3-N-acetylglucosaminyltransferase 2 [Colossoma macropomum]|uniref:N-acetyllactosaminide beta-1,3-N-acetylglucosaminyltransferase 2 n=1 Tax=Colossoma macropomum TaxID=42526 RepID=UPI0018656290|nr:N-acetyllactosaminide beta-1,3-N-acetylglucosaminyltransferase 2 [Colossoma macropomum]
MMTMRRTKTLIVMVLTSSFCLVILYSMLNLQVTHRREVAEIPAVTTRNLVPATTTIGIKENKSTEQPTETKSVPPSSTSAVQQVTVSESFIKDIPKSSAFWNRKMYSLLGQRPIMVNLTGNKLVNGSQCHPESTESLQMNIQDLRSYPELYQDFLQGMDCHSPHILIDQPNKCASVDSKGQVFLLFAVKSTPRHFERRQVVRDTWGREGLHQGELLVRTVFLLGSTSVDDPNLDKLITFEAQEYGDLLVWDFQDSFYNLTLKEHVFFKWALYRCPQVSFIFKGDDDVFANTPAILSHLQSLEPDRASKLYTGQIISDASPLRDIKNKYYVPQSFYEGPYPSYAAGGGFLFSGSLLKPLYIISHYIPFFPIDDVYTGMCFKALGISAEKHEGFQTFDIREQDRENACAHKHLLLVHQRNPRQTNRLWRNMHSPLLTC